VFKEAAVSDKAAFKQAASQPASVKSHSLTYISEALVVNPLPGGVRCLSVPLT